MIQKTANRLTAGMIKKGTIKSDQEAFYQNGLGIIFSTGLALLLVLIVGLISRQGLETVFF